MAVVGERALGASTLPVDGTCAGAGRLAIPNIGRAFRDAGLAQRPAAACGITIRFRQ
jgi:hypothetical protein